MNDDVKHEFCRERGVLHWSQSKDDEAPLPLRRKIINLTQFDNVDIGKTARQQNEPKISQMVSLSPEE